jgi:hypothetical protein
LGMEDLQQCCSHPRFIIHDQNPWCVLHDVPTSAIDTATVRLDHHAVLQLPRVVTAVKNEPTKSFEPLKVQSYNSTLGYIRTSLW